MASPKTMEINPRHPIIASLNKQVREGGVGTKRGPRSLFSLSSFSPLSLLP
jgi:hypothetical protein